MGKLSQSKQVNLGSPMGWFAFIFGFGAIYLFGFGILSMMLTSTSIMFGGLSTLFGYGITLGMILVAILIILIWFFWTQLNHAKAFLVGMFFGGIVILTQSYIGSFVTAIVGAF